MVPDGPRRRVGEGSAAHRLGPSHSTVKHHPGEAARSTGRRPSARSCGWSPCSEAGPHTRRWPRRNLARWRGLSFPDRRRSCGSAFPPAGAPSARRTGSVLHRGSWGAVRRCACGPAGCPPTRRRRRHRGPPAGRTSRRTGSRDPLWAVSDASSTRRCLGEGDQLGQAGRLSRKAMLHPVPGRRGRGSGMTASPWRGRPSSSPTWYRRVRAGAGGPAPISWTLTSIPRRHDASCRAWVSQTRAPDVVFSLVSAPEIRSSSPRRPAVPPRGRVHRRCHAHHSTMWPVGPRHLRRPAHRSWL